MGRRILVVEDHREIRDIVRIFLGQHGFDVTVVATISVCLEVVITESFDLFLLDRMLPDGDGLDLCRRLRQWYPQVPVVFLTALGSPQDEAVAREAGAAAYVRKPAELPRLAQLLEQVLADVKSEDEPMP